MSMLSLITQILLSQVNGIGWTISDDITLSKLLSSIAFDFNSVLFEELLFRGVLLYALIRFTTQIRGILISAAAFGIYHWFTFAVIGNILGMILVLITTGFMGFAFAKAFVKTKSIILPIGLHFGWNWINNSIFSKGPNGTILLVANQSVELTGGNTIIPFLWYLLIPAAVIIFIKTEWFDRLRLKS